MTMNERIEALLWGLLDESPGDLIADGGVTVLDGWRKEAAEIIEAIRSRPTRATEGEVEAAAIVLWRNVNFAPWSKAHPPYRKEYMDLARAALSAAKATARPSEEWRPMETAPKSGEDILALIPCYENHTEHGVLREYISVIVSWTTIGWITGYGDGQKHPIFWAPIPRHPFATKEADTHTKEVMPSDTLASVDNGRSIPTSVASPQPSAPASSAGAFNVQDRDLEAAIRRMTAQLSALQAERDEARTELVEYKMARDWILRDAVRDAKAAEARATAAEAELDEARQRNVSLQQSLDAQWNAFHAQQKRLEELLVRATAAEAERDELQKAYDMRTRDFVEADACATTDMRDRCELTILRLRDQFRKTDAIWQAFDEAAAAIRALSPAGQKEGA